jgi:large subunit ribosomal protein L17
MRHRVAGRKLGRTDAHRKAMLSNMVTSLFDKGRIRTTIPKAKEARSLAERLITKAKTDSVASRRRLNRIVRDRKVLKKLFEEISPRYADRPGGYTRIVRLGYRQGDNAETGILELVGVHEAEKKREKEKKKRRGLRRGG